MIWGIRTWRIVLLAIAFPILAAIGIFSLQTAQDRDFQPQNIQQQAINQRQVEKKTLSAARDLKGSWHGQAKYIFNFTDRSYCYEFFDVILLISTQKDNVITGNANVAWAKGEQHGSFACAFVQTTNDPVRGTISGSRLSVNAGSQGQFSGSFTTDTITLNQPHPAGTDGLVGSVNLLQQHN